MGLDHRLVLLLACCGLSAAALGCRSQRVVEDEHATPPAPPPVRTAEAAAAPVDRVLPDELAEGSQAAFGLLLPRVMRVEGRFDDVVLASAHAPADAVANYVRQRVTAEQVITGPQKTLFARAVVKGSTGPKVSIAVISLPNRTEMEVRNATPKPTQPNQTPEERWRALGLKPDGTLLDPTQLR